MDDIRINDGRHYCWQCGHEIHWENDFTCEEMGCEDDKGVCTMWYCANCDTDYEVYMHIRNREPVENDCNS